MKIAGISSEAVQNATGKDWEEWLDILDGENASEMEHKDIAGMLKNNYNLSGWWSQQVTVGYEQERGMREVHERKDGFEASKSRTFYVGVDRLYRAWVDEDVRGRWLDCRDFTVRKATKNKSLKITWPDETNVLVDFYPKEENKTQVTVQHGKLENRFAVKEKKEYWNRQFKQLKQIL